MSVRICILGSGSKGNATFVGTERTRVLIDAGMSRKELVNRMESIGEDPEKLDAVLVTHEHTDHAGGLRVMVKEMKFEAYMTWGTIGALHADSYELNGSAIVPIQPNEVFRVGDLDVHAFPVPHDAAEPVAYSVVAEGIRITQVTDIGHFSPAVVRAMRGSTVLVMESNHDLEMLRVGPYPWNLKQRLLSRTGHLSNQAVSQYLSADYDGAAQHLFLAHLSSTNNHPELARLGAVRALEARGLDPAVVQVAAPDGPSPQLAF